MDWVVLGVALVIAAVLAVLADQARSRRLSAALSALALLGLLAVGGWLVLGDGLALDVSRDLTLTLGGPNARANIGIPQNLDIPGGDLSTPEKSDAGPQELAPIAGQPGEPVEALEVRFVFGGRDHSLRPVVEGDIYRGALAHDLQLAALPGEDDARYHERHYRSVLEEPSQVRQLDSLHQSLDALASELGLSRDQRVEFMAAFVQSIPYVTDHGPVRFPTEVLVEGGDCDDKSLVLCGLLAREGFSTVLLYFPDDNHAAAGVRAADGAFDGFTMVEGAGKGYFTGGRSTPSSRYTAYSMSSGSLMYGGSEQSREVVVWMDNAVERCIANSDRIEQLRPVVSGDDRTAARDAAAESEALYEEWSALSDAHAQIVACIPDSATASRIVAECEARLAVDRSLEGGQ